MKEHVQKFFLPLNCLKSFILIGAILTIIVGITATFFIIYAFLMSSFWVVFSKTIRTIIIVSILFVCNLIVLSGLSGLYGVLRKKNLFLSIYSFSISVYVLLFIALGLFALLYPNNLLSKCDTPTGVVLQQTVNAANSTLCKPGCQCYFTNYDAYNETQQRILNHTFILQSSRDNFSLPVNATSCPEWNNETQTQSYELYLIQSFFNCSGWCPSDPNYNLIFFFINVNNGPPQNFCFNSLKQLFKKFGLAVILSSFLVSGVLLIVLITLICLCFHPKKAPTTRFFLTHLVQQSSLSQATIS